MFKNFKNLYCLIVNKVMAISACTMTSKVAVNKYFNHCNEKAYLICLIIAIKHNNIKIIIIINLYLH